MLRKLAFSAVLLPCLIGAQGLIKAQQTDRTKALDAAAMTPFFTKRGADAVKKVIAGADARKADEKVLDPLDTKPGEPMSPQGAQGKPVQGQPLPGPGGQSPQAPAPPPVFSWHLLGISYGSRQGMALFQAGNQSVSVFDGSSLDPDTKVVSITKRLVVIEFHGKRLELMPW